MYAHMCMHTCACTHTHEQRERERERQQTHNTHPHTYHTQHIMPIEIHKLRFVISITHVDECRSCPRNPNISAHQRHDFQTHNTPSANCLLFFFVFLKFQSRGKVAERKKGRTRNLEGEDGLCSSIIIQKNTLLRSSPSSNTNILFLTTSVSLLVLATRWCLLTLFLCRTFFGIFQTSMCVTTKRLFCQTICLTKVSQSRYNHISVSNVGFSY